MKQELDDKLCKKYPKIFAERNLPMTETCMCWGFECSDGWYNILDVLCNNIQHHIDWNNDSRQRLLENNPYKVKIPKEVPQVVAKQVKEKFGTLNFYYSGGDEYIRGLVSMAEGMSAFVCEQCGGPGEINREGWHKTLCETHRQERRKRYEKEETE